MQDIMDVVTRCLEVIKIKKGHRGPIKPRIALIGPRGSGRKTQAQLLMKTNGMIHGVYCEQQAKCSHL